MTVFVDREPPNDGPGVLVLTGTDGMDSFVIVIIIVGGVLLVFVTFTTPLYSVEKKIQEGSCDKGMYAFVSSLSTYL